MVILLACRQFHKSNDTPPRTGLPDILETRLIKLKGFATAQGQSSNTMREETFLSVLIIDHTVKYAVQGVK